MPEQDFLNSPKSGQTQPCTGWHFHSPVTNLNVHRHKNPKAKEKKITYYRGTRKQKCTIKKMEMRGDHYIDTTKGDNQRKRETKANKTQSEWIRHKVFLHPTLGLIPLILNTRKITRYLGMCRANESTPLPPLHINGKRKRLFSGRVPLTLFCKWKRRDRKMKQ